MDCDGGDGGDSVGSETGSIDDGGYSDGMCVGGSPSLKQIVAGHLPKISKQLGALGEVAGKSLAVQQQIAAGQAQMTALQAESNEVQRELLGVAHQQAALLQQQLYVQQQQLVVQQQQLLVQRQQLLTQRQQLLANQIGAAQLSIQTQLQLQDKVEREVQRALKEAAYSLKSAISVVREYPNGVLQCAGYFAILVQADQAGLIPNRLDEIVDKEYSRGAILSARTAYSQRLGTLLTEERDDFRFLLQYAGVRRYLWNEVEQATRRAVGSEAASRSALERLAQIQAAEPAARAAAQEEQDRNARRKRIALRCLLAAGVGALAGTAGLGLISTVETAEIGADWRTTLSRALVGIGVLLVVSMTAAAAAAFLSRRTNAGQYQRWLLAELSVLQSGAPAASAAAAAEAEYRNRALANRAQIEGRILDFLSRYPSLEPWF